MRKNGDNMAVASNVRDTRALPFVDRRNNDDEADGRSEPAEDEVFVFKKNFF